jgi:hypothetical protein
VTSVFPRRLEWVTSTISQPYGPQQFEGFNVNGSMSFQLTMK